MSLADELAALLAALEAGGIRAATGGQLAAPCVLVEPGDPWSEPVRMPGRLSRWRLSAIAGAVDTSASVAELAELVDRVDAAIPRGQAPTWGRPTVIDAPDGVRRLASVATIQTTT